MQETTANQVAANATSSFTEHLQRQRPDLLPFGRQLPAAAPAIFGGFRLGLTYILKSVLGLEYVVQVGGVGMWLSEAAFRFEVGEVYAGLVGTTLLSMLFLFMINRGEGLVRK